MISSCSCSETLLVFRVTTSHFSGVVRITWVSYNSFFDNYMSPVYSLTLTPRYFKRLENFSTISEANAFMGDMYTIFHSISIQKYLEVMIIQYHGLLIDMFRDLL